MFNCFKAFSLCAVPGTDFNLSYESLSSHAARQAILALRTTNPEPYKEITSGQQSAPPDEENNDVESDGYEDDADHSIEDVYAMILRARNANEVGQPLANNPEFDEDGYESKDTSIPSSRAARTQISSRHFAS